MRVLPLTPDGVKSIIVRKIGVGAIVFLTGFCAQSPLRAGGIEPWWTVDRAQLQEKNPILDPDAPAEVLDWRITVDDSPRPQSSSIHEYIRYKIFDPEKAVNLTRVSATQFSNGGNDYRNVDVHARLILPDGSTKVFGKESIEERDLQKGGAKDSWLARAFGTMGPEVKEKFLAIGGIVPGAVIEFQFNTKQDYPQNFYAFLLQRPGIPVRHVRFEQVFADSHIYSTSPSVMNSAGMDVKESLGSKKTTLVVTGVNLPGFEDEPYQGPLYSRVLTYMGNYRSQYERLITNHSFESRQFAPDASPWVGYATMAYIAEQDVTRPTKALKQLADSVTADAATDQERARRIHNYVSDLFVRFRKGTHGQLFRPNGTWPEAADVAECGKYPERNYQPVDFLHLAVALYREVGIETQILSLPNNNFVFFSPRLTSDVFLSGTGARVHVGGIWVYTMPVAGVPLPFGALPWENRGGVALVAQDNKAEFVDVPEAPATDTCVSNSGELTLGSDGGLNGHCRRVITGEVAAQVRRNMNGRSLEEAKKHLSDGLKDELKADTADLVSLEGLEDPEKPVLLEYDVHWDNYAEVTKARIIFRPSVFHGLRQSPFSSDVRHNRIVFPYKWTEQDILTLQLPSGYGFESPSMPPSIPGKVFDYSISISVRKKANQLVLSRSMTSNGEAFLASSYSAVKGWFDAVAQSDGHELILVREAKADLNSAGSPTPGHPR